MSNPPTFGRWLRQARIALDLTQESLAERVGCATQTIRKIESGERRPSRDMAERLAKMLEIAPEDQPQFLKLARTTLPTEEPEVVVKPEIAIDVTRPALPVYATPFVGRADELAEVLRLLHDPACQLITLTGPGGMGKTRLAVQAATTSTHFADGVVYVPLAPVTDAALLLQAVADALGLALHRPEDPTAQIVTFLRPKSLLLVLDNLEQLLDGVDLLYALLADAPNVKLLVTSRERLRLQGEWVVELHGLGLPGEDGSGSAEADAVALFVERALRVQHGFTLNDADRRHVVRICRLVGGMPLAIELAASWVRMLSCAEIADEMERSLDFLAATTRDLPGRHHSLRTIFEQSWQLLSADERRVLRELAVFRGGFSRDAARAVAGATLPLLAALVDKSLLLRIGPSRYNLHELVRQYAAEQLATDPVAQGATRDRHSAYFVQFLGDREQPLKSARQLETSMEIRVEIDNIRRAWDRLIEQRRADDLLRAGHTLHWFYEFRNWYAEGASVFQHAAESLAAGSGETHSATFGHLLTIQGYFVMRCGDLGRARDLLGRALQVLEAAGSADESSTTLQFLGLTVFQTGAYTEAGEYIQRGLNLARRDNEPWSIGMGLFFLGTLAHGRGDYETAQQLLHESLAIWREIGNPHLLSSCLNYLSMTLSVLGKWSEAQALLRDSLSVCAATEDRWGFATALNHLGQVAQGLGDRQEARYLFEESLSIFRETGNRWDLARVHNHLGGIAREEERYAESRRYYETALALATEAHATPDALHAVIGLASMLSVTGQPSAALELCLQCLAHPAAGNDALYRATRLRDDLEARLAPDEVAVIRARAEGRSFAATVTELLPVHGHRHAVRSAA